jgi:hypothetical protein
MHNEQDATQIAKLIFEQHIPDSNKYSVSAYYDRDSLVLVYSIRSETDYQLGISTVHVLDLTDPNAIEQLKERIGVTTTL